MVSIKQPINAHNLVRIRWTSATIGGLGVLIFAFYVIKPEAKQKPIDPDQTKPFITLTDENWDPNNGNYEAFFLPTRYNFNLKIKPPKIELDNDSKAASTKPIFSQLDRLRIFRTFTNRFTESEYWTVSRICMHPRQSPSLEKKFIENFNEEITKRSEMLEKIYDSPTEFLFAKHDECSK